MSESKCVLTLEQGQPPSKYWPLPAAKLLKPDDSTLDPFLTACEEADISTVSLLAKHRDEKDGSLNWGLYNALSANRHDIADLLLSQGVPIDKRAVLETKSPECFQVLLDHEWDINSSVECGGTIFPQVLPLKDESLIRWLLSKGANPNLGTPGYRMHSWENNVQPVADSPETIMKAAQHSTPVVLDLLIVNGAKYDRVQLLHIAVTSIFFNTAERIAMMDHLVNKLGIDINAVANVSGSEYEGGTALHGAAVWRRLPEAKWLLEHGADVRAGNKFHYLPYTKGLRCAQDCCHMEVANFLKEWELSSYGSNIGARTDDGWQERNATSCLDL